MRRSLAILCLLSACATAPAATWYLDASANADTNGTSWWNAWNNPTNINWSAVNPGDTIEVAGGNYPHLIIADSGTEGSPITLKVSQTDGRNGRVSFRGISVWGNWITIDGAKSDTYGAGVTNVANLWTITNNINLLVKFGLYPGSDYDSGHTFKWVEITNNNTRADADHGIRWNATDPLYQCKVEYCYIHDVGYDSISATAGNATNYDGLVIHHTILWQPQDDTYEGTGCNINHCILGRARRDLPIGADPDGIQTVGNYVRFYNNVLCDMNNSLFQCQGQAAEGGYYGHFQIYGNLFFFNQNHWLPAHSSLAAGNDLELKWYPASAAWNRYGINYSNWIVCNNTFYRLNGGGWAWEARVPVAGQVGWISNIYCTNISFLNNVFLSCTNTQVALPRGWSVQTVGEETGSNYWHWGPGQARFDYNVFATNDGQTISVSWMGTNFASGEALAAASPYISNRSDVPNIPGMRRFDFRPATADTALRGRGTNLAGLNLPGWTNDLYGVPRGAAPAIGACEAAPTIDDATLLVHLRFDDVPDSISQRYEDYSGHERHGWRFGRPGSTYPTNFPPVYLRATGGVTNTPGRTGGRWDSTDYAVDCKWWTNTDYGLYKDDGQYLAVTNCAGITTYTGLTACCWAKFHSYTNIEGASDYSACANDCLISFGSTATSTEGAWNLGRYNYNINQNEVRFYCNTNTSQDQWVVNYSPEGNMMNSGGDSTNWHHYAFTWANGIWIGYLNGSAFSTQNMSGTTTSLALGHSTTRPYDWIGVGVDCHLGTPPLEDEDGTDYPNNAWHNGLLDEVRIYSRALTAAEVAALAAGEAVEAPAPAPTETSPRVWRTGRLRVGSLRRP